MKSNKYLIEYTYGGMHGFQAVFDDFESMLGAYDDIQGDINSEVTAIFKSDGFYLTGLWSILRILREGIDVNAK